MREGSPYPVSTVLQEKAVLVAGQGPDNPVQLVLQENLKE